MRRLVVKERRGGRRGERLGGVATRRAAHGESSEADGAGTDKIGRLARSLHSDVVSANP